MALRALLGPVVLVLLVGGCLPARGPTSNAPLPLVPMFLVFAGPRETGEPIGGLLADGSIVMKQGGVVGRLLPDRVVTPDGKPKIVVTPGGDVIVDPRLPPMRFDARGALVSGNGETIWVDDAGTPSWIGPGTRGLPPMNNVRFTPFNPAGRRTAEVLLLVIMEAAWSRPLG